MGFLQSLTSSVVSGSINIANDMLYLSNTIHGPKKSKHNSNNNNNNQHAPYSNHTKREETFTFPSPIPSSNRVPPATSDPILTIIAVVFGCCAAWLFFYFYIYPCVYLCNYGRCPDERVSDEENVFVETVYERPMNQYTRVSTGEDERTEDMPPAYHEAHWDRLHSDHVMTRTGEPCEQLGTANMGQGMREERDQRGRALTL